MTEPNAGLPAGDGQLAEFDEVAVSPKGGISGRSIVDRLLDAGILLSLAGLVILFSVLSPQFLTVNNLVNILNASAIVGLVAVGMTIALIAGQFDLSVGSIVGFSSVTLALGLTTWGLTTPLALIAAVVLSLGFGLFAGFLVVNLGINSIIATLGMLAFVRGVSYVMSSGVPIVTSDSFLNSLGVDRLAGIPIPVVVTAFAYVAAYVLLTRTRLGVHIYATGGNPVAAERSGIKVNSVIRLVFLITAFTAAIGGILMTARTFSGQAVYGQNLELDVLTAVLLGGVGLRGGQGRIEKTLIGVLIVGVLANGMILTQVPGFYMDIARGAVLILAVVLEATRERRGRR